MNKNEFLECVEMLRSSDPMTFEDGYDWIQGYLNDYIDELIELMLSENDSGMRGKYIELLGDSLNPKVIEVLSGELKNDDREVRSWAFEALKKFDDQQSRQVIHDFIKSNPSEDFI